MLSLHRFSAIFFCSKFGIKANRNSSEKHSLKYLLENSKQGTKLDKIMDSIKKREPNKQYDEVTTVENNSEQTQSKKFDKT